MNKPAVTEAPLAEILRMRWSPRAFDGSKPLTLTQMQSLFEAARWAPSCYGDEPWRYLVFDRFANPEVWQQAITCLTENNQRWAKAAPLLLFALANEKFRHNGEFNRWAQYDTGAASINLCLQAVALGLAAHQMGGFDARQVSLRFSVPEHVRPMAAIVVGYQAAADKLPDDLRERECAPRKRQTLDALFFDGVWGTPWKPA